MRRRSPSAWSALPLLTIAAAAHAVPVEMIVTAVGAPADDGTVGVQVTFLNERNDSAELTIPDQVAASVLIGGSITAVSLQRAGVGTGAITVAPGGFARADYTVRLPDARGSIGVLTLADGSIGYTVGSKTRTTPLAGNSTMVVVAKPHALPTADRGNSFLGKLSAYEPIYAVYGPGTSTDALFRLVLSTSCSAAAALLPTSAGGLMVSRSPTLNACTGISARSPRRFAPSISSPSYFISSCSGI